VGAHLHPWDCPPSEEDLTDFNSYPGNLPAELERSKLAKLSTTIEQNLGIVPRSYKAGRYGVGPSTTKTLAALGYQIDLSVVPGTDLRPYLGPDFRECGAKPYWFGADPGLLEIPMSVGFTGGLAKYGVALYEAATTPAMRKLHMPAILARSHLLDRIILTPEGVTHLEHRRLTRRMLREGHRVFSFTYHSPSLAVGKTPYVRSDADLRGFLDKIERYLDFFINEIGGRPSTPSEIYHLALQSRQGAAAAS
jgi:hypothetical protein